MYQYRCKYCGKVAFWYRYPRSYVRGNCQEALSGDVWLDNGEHPSKGSVVLCQHCKKSFDLESDMLGETEKEE